MAECKKKARLDLDEMEVDSAQEVTAALVSMNPLAATSDSEILAGLLPIVFKLTPYPNAALLCSDLNELNFLRLHSSISSAAKEQILQELSTIYSEARSREVARIATEGEHVELQHREAALEICNAILHSELKTIDEETGLQIYENLVPDLQNPGFMTTEIIRREDRLFWDRCIDISMKDHPVCGVGNPGIGKTTTTFYLLQQLIVTHAQPVVYTIRKRAGLRDIFYEFVPDVQNGQVRGVTAMVHGVHANEKTRKIPSMRTQGAFYVVDPGKFEGSCDDTDELYAARFIMAASNGNKHWGGKEFEKFRGPSTRRSHLLLPNRRPNLLGGKFIYGCLWTAAQLLLAKHYLDNLFCLYDDEVLRRFRIVGGSIGDILTFNEKQFKKDVETALNLNATTVQELSEGRYMFAFDTTEPSNMLIAIGPDYQDWGQSIISLKSDYVEERLANKYLRMSWYDVGDEDNAGNRRNLFESYVRLKFSTSPVIFEENEVRESRRQLPESGKKNERKNYQLVPQGMTVGQERQVVRVSNMNASVQKDQAQKYMYYSKNESEPLVDMVYRVNDGYHAIQATISRKHNAETEKIRTLKNKLGLKSHEKLRIFYAVPSNRYNQFETKPVNPLYSQEDLNDVHIYHVSVSANT